MARNHARKNAARARSAVTGESHQAAINVVRKRTSRIPRRLTSAEMAIEGRAKIAEALTVLAAKEARPRLREFLLALSGDVEACDTSADLYPPRANYAFRRADDYYRQQWDRVSTNPPTSYEEHLAAINRAYWARRVAYEWRWPGRWDKHL
ncbi:hypothetical protein ACIQU6_41350 [Streptomyces sp. NPDC090442]|uniref:hypothetical protein n=1 Tax=Streptomyces sp. NPDC090442 TaxID=3365962 RepID=UPI003819129C